ncbi:hypothetical protein [Halostella pelagica]|uniref:hypothetical protein n=1 Tax=Halostella pelagica TaxID=2583824 RepID=UPI0010818259|nr:hypothetical protein [Halostella pelagica]
MSDRPDVAPGDALQVAQRALSKVDELEQRVDELEETTDAAASGGRDFDDRDSAVVERLDPGEAVPVGRLRKLYRRHTDIRSEDTLKKRIQGLVASPDFAIAGVGEIHYDPDGGDGA